jgi:hypothetical protein
MYIQDQEDDLLSTTLTPVLASTSEVALPSTTLDIVTLLGIPLDLTNRNNNSLRVAYEKFVAHARAFKTMQLMVSQGTWKRKRLTGTELVELFVSKSMWFRYFSPNFSKVSNFADMILWLEDDDGCPSDLAVWGFEKSTYNFKDLAKYLADGGPLQPSAGGSGKKLKGKRKANDGAGGRKKVQKSGSSKIPVSE